MDMLQGLTQQVAQEILARDGPNKLTATKGVSEWSKFSKQVFGGFQLLLWAGAALCLGAFAMQFSSPGASISYDNVSTRFR